MLKKLALISAAVGLASILAVASVAYAAPGGNGKGKAVGRTGGSDAPQATISADPNPSDAYSYVRVKGCGFDNSTWVEVHFDHGAYSEAWAAGVWADGCIDFGFWTAEAGTYHMTAYQTIKNSTRLMAEGDMVVQ